MYKIFFNESLFSVYEDEDKAIGLAINLHKSSNVKHNIVVSKEDKILINFFIDASIA